jgi:hypothetical protein
MSRETLRRYYDNVIPLPKIVDDAESVRKLERVRKEHDAFEGLFEKGCGNNMRGVSGTLWAAYNSVIEYTDYRKTRSSYEKRLQSVWFGRGAALKARAFRVAETWSTFSNAA